MIWEGKILLLPFIISLVIFRNLLLFVLIQKVTKRSRLDYFASSLLLFLLESAKLLCRFAKKSNFLPTKSLQLTPVGRRTTSLGFGRKHKLGRCKSFTAATQTLGIFMRAQ